MKTKELNTKYSVFPSLRLYDTLGINYIVGSDLSQGPLWTGFAMLLDVDDDFGDPVFFHELAHWLIATPSQRRRPDFGLGQQPNASSGRMFTSSTMTGVAAPKDAHFEPLEGRGWGEECVSTITAERQERLACIALAVYEPLAGVCGWDDRLSADYINTALYDFGGVDVRHTAIADIRAIHAKVVTPICEAAGTPVPTVETVTEYVRHVSKIVYDDH